MDHSSAVRAFLLLLFLPFFSHYTLAVTTFQNPLKTTDGSDPFIVYSDGYYWLTTTTWTNLQLTKATTLAGLKTATATVVYSDSTASRCCNVWAPEIHKIDGTWYMYYVAGISADTGSQHIHVLQGGSTPASSWSYKGQLDATNAAGVWSIDPTVLTISGSNYLVYSAFSPNSLQSLYIAPMTNAYTLGARTLLSEPTLSWETVSFPVNEGPAALYSGSNVWLTYSASGCWTSSYALGMLTWNGGTPTLAASWTKSSTAVFVSANGDYGPGHNGFFKSKDGTADYIVYHASSSSTVACDGTRRTFAQPVYYHTNGQPNFGSPRAVTDNIPVPSGD